MIEEIISGNSFKELADDFIDVSKPYIDLSKTPKIIFLYTDWLELFKEKVLPNINYNFKLITHNADRSAPSNNIDLLEDDRLIMWYGMNCDVVHDKLQPIPIGIANEKWLHGDKNTLNNVISEDIEKQSLCYSNYDIATNPIKRKHVFDVISSKNFIEIESGKLNFIEYVRKLKSYKYVISPPGNSVDCHRIWESIYLGVIPIVERNDALQFWEDCPILFVDSFSHVTKDLLESKYDELKQRSNKKALLSYYKNIIL